MPRKPLLLGSFLSICLLSVLTTCFAAAAARTWTEKLAASEMKRRGDSLFFGKDARAKWAYETGVFLKGLEALWRRTGDVKYYE